MNDQSEPPRQAYTRISESARTRLSALGLTQLCSMAFRQSRMRLLDPKNDVVFKLLFAAPRHQTLLIAFLTDVLAPKVPITSAQVLNPEIPRDFNLQKGVVLDVRIQLGNGRLVDVEMQARRQRAFRERVLLYWARQFGAQLEIGQKYREVLPCVGIYVLDFTDFEGHNFHHVFRVYDLQSGELFSDAFEMHFLELPKVPSEPRSNPLEQWCSFFRVRSEQDLEALAMSSPTMKQASEALWWVSNDPNSRQLAEMRELGEFNHRLQMNAERRLGHEQGLVEGLRHEVRTVARVLKLDWSPARQAYVEGLSATELEQLIAELVENKCWADDG